MSVVDKGSYYNCILSKMKIQISNPIFFTFPLLWLSPVIESVFLSPNPSITIANLLIQLFIRFSDDYLFSFMVNQRKKIHFRILWLHNRRYNLWLISFFWTISWHVPWPEAIWLTAYSVYFSFVILLSTLFPGLGSVINIGKKRSIRSGGVTAQ